MKEQKGSRSNSRTKTVSISKIHFAKNSSQNKKIKNGPKNSDREVEKLKHGEEKPMKSKTKIPKTKAYIKSKLNEKKMQNIEFITGVEIGKNSSTNNSNLFKVVSGKC